MRKVLCATALVVACTAAITSAAGAFTLVAQPTTNFIQKPTNMSDALINGKTGKTSSTEANQKLGLPAPPPTGYYDACIGGPASKACKSVKAACPKGKYSFYDLWGGIGAGICWQEK